MPALPRIGDDETARIRQYARGTLRAAGIDRLIIPTPLDDVTATLNLHPVQDLFDLGDAPAGLVARLRRLQKKVVGALAIRERTIYVDMGQAQERVRFTHGHELGHRVLPGHQELYYADDVSTLHPDVRSLLEAEANQFSAELLFQTDLFTEMASGTRIGMGVPLELAGRFVTSFHAAIRRYVETSTGRCALAIFGHHLVQPDGRPSMKIISAIESPAFRGRYGALGACIPGVVPVCEQFGADALSSLRGTGGAVIDGTTSLSTDRGLVAMHYEIFSNTYFAFALIYPVRRISLGTRIHVARRE